MMSLCGRSRLWAASAALGLGTVVGVGCAARDSDLSKASEVWLVDVEEGAGLSKDGLQAGDVLVAWRAVSSDRRGELHPIRSPFDWERLRRERSSDRPVRLAIRRDGRALDLTLSAAEWGRNVVMTARSEAEGANLQEAERLAATGDLAGALGRWRAMRASARERRELSTAASLTLRMARAHASVEDWTSALSVLEASPPDEVEPSQWLALEIAVGEVHEAAGNLDEALEAFTRAAELQRSIQPETVGLARTLDRMGAIELRLHRLESADDRYREASEILSESAPLSLLFLHTLRRRGVVARRGGRLERAEDFYLQCLGLAEQIGAPPVEVAKILNNLGVLEGHRGRLEPAERLYRRALGIYEATPDGRSDWVLTTTNLADILARRGEFAAVERLAREAVHHARRLNPNGPLMVQALSSQARGAFYSGRPEAARDLLLEVLSIQKVSEASPVGMAITLNRIGLVVSRLDQLDEAAGYYERAMELLKEHAPQDKFVPVVLTNWSELTRRRGRLDESERLARRALARFEELAPGGMDVAHVRSALANISLQRGHFQRAEGEFRAALEITGGLAPASLDHANALHGLARVAQASGDEIAAVDFSWQAVAALEAQINQLGGTHRTSGGYRAEHAEIYDSLVRGLVNQGRAEEAFEVLERLRGLGFVAMLAQRDLVFTGDLPPELDARDRELAALSERTRSELGDLSPLRDKERVASLASDLERFVYEREELIAEVRRSSARLAALRYPSPAGAHELPPTVGSGVLLLSYAVQKEGTLLFAWQHGRGMVVHEIGLGAEELSVRVNVARRLIGETRGAGSGFGDRRAALDRVLGGLFEQLLAPALPWIEGADSLLIIPSGPLQQLPFAALRVAVPGPERREPRYLIEWKPLHIAQSATGYREVRAWGQESEPLPWSAGGPLLAAFGDPRTREWVGGAREPSLPHTRREIAAIAAIAPGGRALTYFGPRATELRAVEAGRLVEILHFATHARSNDRLPLESGIVLAAENRPVLAPEANGFLQAWEIFERVRLRSQLVVLSACSTGLTSDSDGPGLGGLAQAFQFAGARAVVASLWEVSDSATAELMTVFYRKLRGGLPIDRALQGAQISLLRDPNMVLGEGVPRGDSLPPYYWAGFQLFGDPRPLRGWSGLLTGDPRPESSDPLPVPHAPSSGG